MKWAKEGEGHNKLFHKTVTGRKEINLIDQVGVG
jgi:hypothetical protein